MSTLLPPHAHNALIARWAWYAYRDNEDGTLADTQRARDETWRAAYDSVLTIIEDMIRDEAVRLTNRRPEDPASYVDALLAWIRDAVGPAYEDQRETILNSYRRYLRWLVVNNGDPLMRMCKTVIAAVICLYRHHSISVPNRFSSRIQIRADHDIRKPKGTFESPFSGAARVAPGCAVDRCCDGTKKHLQTLRLTLIPNEFDRDTLSALPFVLFHECVSHVMQGPWTLNRRQPDSASEFAEGWMDLAALTVFEHVLHGRWPCARRDLVPYAHGRDFFESGGRRMCEARHARPTQGSLDHAMSCRYQGWKAAQHTLTAMQQGRFTDPTAAFLRLSFRLNVSDLCPAERDTVTQLLGSALRPDKLTAKQSKALDVLGALRGFAAQGDLDRLLAVVRHTKSTRKDLKPVSSVSRLGDGPTRLPFAK